ITVVSPEEREIRGGLLVYKSSLLDALVALWESFWQSARPLAPDRAVTSYAQSQGLSLTDAEARIVQLLLVGHKSQTIATQLGLSKPTIDRRIGDIMHKVGAETRFQAGF